MSTQVVALHPGKTIAEAAEAFLHRDIAAADQVGQPAKVFFRGNAAGGIVRGIEEDRLGPG